MNKANQQASVKAIEETCVTCGGPHPYYECLATDSNTFNASAMTGTYNQGANPRGDLKAITTRSGVAYDGPMIIPTHSPLPKEVERKAESVLKFLQIFRRLHFDLSFADALLHIPKFASTFKNLLSNKNKLFKLANTPLTENCSAVLLKQLPKKLRDLGIFLIPCDFQELESCMALADLGASINLMHLYVWKKLSLPDLTPIHMTLELATRSTAYLAGIAKDVFVQVGKFTFQADFVVVDYDVNPRVPLILGRPFLRMARALVDVHREELILRDGDEKLIFHADSTPKHHHKHGNYTTSLFDSSPSLTPFETSDSLLKEFVDELALFDPFPPGKEDNNFDFEADLREIEYLLNQNPSTEFNIETIDPILEKFTDEPALDYLPPLGDDNDDDDDLFDLKSNNHKWKKLLYDDCY
nr:reverse transcriptase domain-containing protein [Tanacetum cinerariifolium]